ncbi:MAG: hypothetical protein ABEJ67_02600 [Halanaeroarchaeum sp.]
MSDIENNTGSTAAYVESGSFTADTVHLTGDGNLNITGFDSATNVYSGSDADSPATSLSELDGSSSTDSTSGDSTSTDSASSLDKTLTVDGSTSTEKHYHFEVSGEVEAGSQVNSDDTVNASSVDGTMFSGSDSYNFSGDLTEFTSDSLDEMTVYVDGSRIDPTSIGSLDNEISIEGTTSTAKSYSFTVSGEVQAGDNVNPDDSVGESSVDAVVWSSTDSYTFSGEITELTVESPEDVTVRVNGTVVDPATIGSQPLPNRLVFDGSSLDGRARYTFEVSEAVEKSTDLGDLESDDEISGTTVTGTIGNDVDAYRFAGDLVSMDVDGPVVVTIEQ